jgi:ankyrin repeat protein
MFRCVRWHENEAGTVGSIAQEDGLEQLETPRPVRDMPAHRSRDFRVGERIRRWWRSRRVRHSATESSANQGRQGRGLESMEQARRPVEVQPPEPHARSTQARGTNSNTPETSFVCEEALSAWVALLRREKAPAEREELCSWIRDNLDALSKDWELLETGLKAPPSGWTALKQAAYFGNASAVELLVEYGAWRELLPAPASFPDHRPEHNAAGAGRRIEVSSSFPAESDRNVPAALYLAAQNGHLEALREMLRYRSEAQRNQRLPPPDIDCRTSIGWTPLFIAAWNGHEEVCRLLLAAGADPRTRDHHGWTPIMAAVTRNHFAVVRLLVQVGGIHPRLVRARRGWTPLHAAAENGSVEIVQFLLQHGAEASVANGEGWTPLHAAAKHGHLAVLRVLIESGGVSPNIARHDGSSVLHTAVRYGHADIVSWLLLEAGASPLQQDRAGRTALHVAVACGHAEICNLLVCLSPAVLIDITNHAGGSALTTAFAARRYDLCLWLLQLGACLPENKYRTVIGRKLMHYLATPWWQQTTLVRPSGATVFEARVGSLSMVTSVPDDSDDRHFFATVVCIRRLVSLGVDVNIKRKIDGGTPLHTAAMLANAQGIDAFVQAVGGGRDGALALEAITIGPGTRGEAPLHYACAQAHLDTGAETVVALLQAGSSPWARDRRRRTPLHVAAAVGAQDHILRMLVEQGAPHGDLVYARDSRGSTPLDIAREAGKIQAHLVLTSMLGLRHAWNASTDEHMRTRVERSSWQSVPVPSRSTSRDNQQSSETASIYRSEEANLNPNDATLVVSKLQALGAETSFHTRTQSRDDSARGLGSSMFRGRSMSQRPPAPSTVYTPSSRASSVTSNSTLPLYQESLVEYRWRDYREQAPVQTSTSDDAAPPSNGSALFSQITNASASQSSGEQSVALAATATGPGMLDATDASIGNDAPGPESGMARGEVMAAVSVPMSYQQSSLSLQTARSAAAVPANTRRATFLSRVMARDWWPSRPFASAPPIPAEVLDPDIGRRVNDPFSEASSDTYSELSAAPSALLDSSLSITDSMLTPYDLGSDRTYRVSTSDASRALVEPECAVCADSGPCVQWTAYNCGHCTCQKCAERLSECPMCRVAITSRIRLYL